MKINIRTTHFTINNEDRDYAADKIGNLEKYFKNIIGADIHIICDHEDAAGSTYTLRVTLKIPGKDLFAETSARDIRAGIDEIEDKLHQQIIKLREKRNPMHIHKAKEWVKNFFGR